MLKKMRITEWQLEVDVLKTKEYYDNHKIEIDCKCSSCKNYRANCQHLSRELLEFFLELGIDPSKEGEFMEFGQDRHGNVVYMGFYHIVGKIIDGPDFVDDKWEQLHLLKIDQYEFGFSSREIRCVPNDFPMPVIQLEFKTVLPWIIKEPIE